MTNSRYTAGFIAQMPAKVNFIMCTDYGDDSGDSLMFYLKSGSGTKKVWQSDSSYSNWGYFDLSNAEVARQIQEFEKEAKDASINFGHKDANGNIHADWDWSEVSGTAKKYLAGHTTKVPCKKPFMQLKNSYKKML